ncbi:MAG: hypothetical protein AAGG08_08735, partial [Actinomycetota bacterium]
MNSSGRDGVARWRPRRAAAMVGVAILVAACAGAGGDIEDGASDVGVGSSEQSPTTASGSATAESTPDSTAAPASTSVSTAGEPSATSDPGASATTGDTASDPDTGTDTARATTGSSGSSDTGSAPAPESATIVVDSLVGELELPADPQRVVVLDAAMVVGTLLDLGVPVVGMLDERPDTLTADESAAMEPVGNLIEPRLETIARLEPDLIMATIIDRGLFDVLSEIAPTFPVDITNDWRQDVRLVAGAVNRADEIEVLLDDFDVRAEAVRS